MRRLLAQMRPGVRMYLPGATGECLALAQHLAREADRIAGVNITSCLLPGFNNFDYAALHPDARLTCFMLPPALRASFQAGRVDLMPLTYMQIARFMAKHPFDIAVAHAAAPNANGECSLGVCADFTPIVWPRARCKVLIINAAIAPLIRSPHLRTRDADIVIEIDPTPLPTSGPARPRGDAEARVAAAAAALVPDGASLQVGIGAIASMALPLLRDHKNLRIASGFVGPEVLGLLPALDPSCAHVTGVALGEAKFYDDLMETPLRFASVLETHNVPALAALPRFTAINSALEIDLFGQVNLEWRGETLMNGAGGAPEFAAAAMQSEGGRSIIAMPAMAGAHSKIVAQLRKPASLSRSLIDTVVTEHGVAELRHASLDARAHALIAIAEPSQRAALERAWRDMRAAF